MPADHPQFRALPDHTMLPAAPDAAFDRIARLTRKLLDVPTALVSLVDRERQAFPGAIGLPEPWQTERETPLSYSFCQYVVAQGEPLVVPDARLDARLAPNAAIDDLGVIAYAGMPLTDRSGAVIGSLCAIDAVARQWTLDELADLADLAVMCSAELHVREASSRATRAAQRAETLISTMPVGFMAYDQDWRITAANAEAARIVDATVDALIGQVLWERFPATIGSQFEEIYRRVQASGTTDVFEYFYPEPLNKWYEIRVQSDRPGVSVYFHDVTARHAGEARANEILTTMPVGFIALDDALRIIAVNAQGARLAGSTVDALVGRGHHEVVPWLAGPPFDEAYRRVAHTGRSEVIEAVKSKPRQAWFDVRIARNDGQLSLYVVDVSARHEVQILTLKQAESDRSVATTLQQAMLAELPDVPGLELAARYLTATGVEQVGGDWYDAFVQPDGTLTVSIGDVSGHGIGAAATMGQLRAMLRGFLWDDTGPLADNLSRLDQATASFDGSVVATAIAARVEPNPADGGYLLRWSNAGHLSPILIGADGSIETLEAEVELMLGVAPDFARHDHTHALPVGSTLVLYTNGLVETPTDTLAAGVERLADAIRWYRVYELDELLDSVLAELRAERRDDDIAVIAIRVAQ